jgi:hypothetical protein
MHCIPCTVRVLRQEVTREDAIGSHTCSLEVSMRVTNGILSGGHSLTGSHCKSRPNTEGTRSSSPWVRRLQCLDCLNHRS